MLRDWKQSEERHLCRRTVLVGLVGLLLSGSGIIWLTNACRSRSKPTLPFTYQGHSDPVLAVAWSPDGQRIASASFDRTVQVWNTTDWGQVYTYRIRINLRRHISCVFFHSLVYSVCLLNLVAHPMG